MFEDTINAVLANSNGYSIQTPADSDDLVRRETTLRADDYPATLKAVVVAAQVPTLTLSGEIDCIEAGERRGGERLIRWSGRTGAW